MGEYYWGTLELTFPDQIVLEEGVVVPITPGLLEEVFPGGYGGGVADFEELAHEWLRTTLGRRDDDLTATESAAFDAVHEFFDGLTGLSVALSYEMVDYDGLRVEIGGEHNFGIAHYYDSTDVEEFCQTHGISYRMHDDGKNELPGEERSWSPGMAEPEDRGHSAAGTVLDAADATALLAKAGSDDAEFRRLVCDYLRIDDSPADA